MLSSPMSPRLTGARLSSRRWTPSYFGRILFVGVCIFLVFHFFGGNADDSGYSFPFHPADERLGGSNAPSPPPLPKRTSKSYMPQTNMVVHSHGYNVIDNVYMANETLFIITDEPTKWPELNTITSSGEPLGWTPAQRAAREPTPWHISFITERDARERWGGNVWTVEGVTVFVNEPNQFLGHYYHWIAETWLGIQRIYAAVDPNTNVYGETVLEDVSRFIFRHVKHSDFLRWARINHHVTQTVYPSAGIETKEHWEARGRMTSDQKSAWRFSRMVLADRGASFRDKRFTGRNHRTAWAPWEATQNVSSRWWWEPIRRKTLEAARVPAGIINIPVKWKDWQGHFRGDYKPTKQDLQILKEAPGKLPIVITYVSRQMGRRHMIPEQEEVFVKEMEALCKRRGWKWNHTFMQLLTVEEQLAVAAETTVLVGVHGNGLSHLLWMPLTPLTTVVEIFVPGGLSKDYEWTSRALGMTHYAIWNDTAYTHPKEPKVDYPPGDHGFQGNFIPIHGPSVAKIIEDRLDGRLIILDYNLP